MGHGPSKIKKKEEEKNVLKPTKRDRRIKPNYFLKITNWPRNFHASNRSYNWTGENWKDFSRFLIQTHTEQQLFRIQWMKFEIKSTHFSNQSFVFFSLEFWDWNEIGIYFFFFFFISSAMGNNGQRFKHKPRQINCLFFYSILGLK